MGKLGPYLLALVVIAALSASVGRTFAAPEKEDGFVTVPQLRESGWKAPRPPYPAEARTHHENGTVYLRLTTDADGKIAEAVLAKEPESVKSDAIRKEAVSSVQYNWHGPPKSKVNEAIIFRLD